MKLQPDHLLSVNAPSRPPRYLWHPGPNAINLRRGNCPHPELTASLTSLLPLPVVNASGCGPLITACLPHFIVIYITAYSAETHKDTVFLSIRSILADPDETYKTLWNEIQKIQRLDIWFHVVFLFRTTKNECLCTWLLAPWDDVAPWACDRWMPSWWRPPRWPNPSTPSSAGR